MITLLTQASFQKQSLLVRFGEGNVYIESSVEENILDEMNEEGLRIIHLPETFRKVFSVYYQWLVTAKLQSKYPTLAEELHSLAHACILGHYLSDIDFIDSVHDAALQCCTEEQMATLQSLIAAGTLLHASVCKVPRSSSPFIRVAAWLLAKEKITVTDIRQI
jgi:hypothetical protein